MSIGAITEPEYLSATGFCFPCKASFSDQSALEKHVPVCRTESSTLAAHLRETPYKCVRCNLLFSKSNVKQHLEHMDIR